MVNKKYSNNIRYADDHVLFANPLELLFRLTVNAEINRENAELNSNNKKTNYKVIDKASKFQ